MVAVSAEFANAQYGEAALWWIIAVVFLLYAGRARGGARRRCLLAAATFGVFGLTDVVEAHTGAWWRPWWLLLVKGGCLAAMMLLLFADWRAKRAPNDQ